MKASQIGRFEQSFMFHMIRDFFLLLLIVAAVELSLRYALVLYDFRYGEPARVDRAAQQLAADVKSIMLNAGGPTAAVTVYPILNRNYDDLGLAIAVVPAEVTVASMRASRGMEAKGLPAKWPTGSHNEASVNLTAEQYCLGCHVQAKVGEVLGTVTVRGYLSRKEDVWWHEVRLTGGVLAFNIIVHTIVLFLLLKVRMEPLLALRSTVSGLAKGVIDLSPRARVKSEDEFAELALDLNHFLDRISIVVHDLDRILSEVVTVGARLGALNRQLERQLDGLRDTALRGIGDDARRGLDTQVAVARESGAFAVLADTLDALAADPAGSGGSGAAQAALMREQLRRLRTSFTAVTDALQSAAPAITVPEAQSAEYQAFAQSLREMALLEATMQTVAESGQTLLQRLTMDRQRRLAASKPEPAAG